VAVGEDDERSGSLMAVRGLLRTFFAALVVLGCGRVDVNTAGLPCPCSDGNSCDPVCNVCVPPGTSNGVVCSECKVRFSDFHADWVTPNGIGWKWKVYDRDAGPDFTSYTLTLTSSQGTEVFDSTTNPELGIYSLPLGGKDIVEYTITSGLQPNVTYTGTLVALDESGCAFSSTSTARATLQPALNVAIPIFSEQSTGNIAAQDGMVTSDDCYAGNTCLQSPTPACVLPDGGTDCSNLLKYADLDIEITEDNLTEGQFEDAYLEVWTKTQSPSPTWYAWVWLRTLNVDQNWAYFAFTLPNNRDYAPVQIPLGQLVLQGGSDRLTREILVQGHIREFVLGSLVEPTSTTIKADEVYIRR
jgi:hypothetical protein